MQADQSKQQPGKATPTSSPLYPFEQQDSAILDKFVKPYYQPSEVPLVMSVGYSCIREGMILRDFHERSYGFSHDAPKVIACNIHEFKLAGTSDQLDKIYMGPAAGNLLDGYTWFKPLIDLGISERCSYDFSYVRNPDLVDITKWGYLFTRAVEMTSPTGVVVTLVRRSDVTQFDKLRRYLQGSSSIEPALVCETGMSLSSDSLDQHHLLAVFKNEARI